MTIARLGERGLEVLIFLVKDGSVEWNKILDYYERCASEKPHFGAGITSSINTV